MRIYTYYAPVPKISAKDELALIHLWEENWRKNGYEPVVLGPCDAQNSPIYHRFRSKILTFPTPNPPGYDEACWLRWLAYSMQKEPQILVADYDCFSYGFQPTVLDAAKVHLYCGPVPCLAHAAPEIIAQMCEFMMASRPGPEDHYHGTPIYEDQHYIRKAMKDFPTFFVEKWIVKEYMELGWEEAPVVHFCNNRMPALRPRWFHIPRLRSW